MKYVAPVAEVVELDVVNVLLASGACDCEDCEYDTGF